MISESSDEKKFVEKTTIPTTPAEMIAIRAMTMINSIKVNPFLFFISCSKA
jgi:hypothetical protein